MLILSSALLLEFSGTPLIGVFGRAIGLYSFNFGDGDLGGTGEVLADGVGVSSSDSVCGDGGPSDNMGSNG